MRDCPLPGLITGGYTGWLIDVLIMWVIVIPKKPGSITPQVSQVVDTMNWELEIHNGAKDLVPEHSKFCDGHHVPFFAMAMTAAQPIFRQTSNGSWFCKALKDQKYGDII